MMNEYLVIEVSSKKIAVELGAVLEINRVSNIHDVPHYGKGYVGMLNIRNRTIPVYDLSLVVFGVKTNITTTTKILTVSTEETIALICDDVVGTVGIDILERKEGVFKGQLLYDNKLIPVLDLKVLWKMIMSDKDIKTPEVCIIGAKSNTEFMKKDELSEDVKEREQKHFYLICKVAKEFFAIPAELIRETVKVEKITHVPGLPSYLSGICSIRGEIIPVIDLRILFLMDENEEKAISDVVIIQDDLSKFGLKVESVEELVGKEISELRSPQHLGNIFSNFITNQFEYENTLASILNLKSLIEKIKNDQGGKYELAQEN